MRNEKYDVTVVGGGPAGMSAALGLQRAGCRVALLEREAGLGGILMQCIHNGFGLQHFQEDLTGPEYAERLMAEVGGSSGIDTYTDATVTSVTPERGVTAMSPKLGVLHIENNAVVLAMGCRERNRGNIAIPGTRPSGIFTAGYAQKLVNLQGLLPGKEAVIIGSGDIGLIMARRLTWSGVKVKAVIEIMPYPGGLIRNIVQCLDDFEIPLYLSHTVTNIFGRDRVSGLEIAKLDENRQILDESKFTLDCDTILLSVGLIPENELSRDAGIQLSNITQGPIADSDLMTSAEGIFACGNVLHVHDLVDFVSAESERCAQGVMRYLERGPAYERKRTRLIPGHNVHYLVPDHIDPEQETVLFFRPMIVGRDVYISVKADGQKILRKKHRQVQPSEMIQVALTPKDMIGERAFPAQIEVSIEQEEL